MTTTDKRPERPANSHVVVEPAILYFGTPVILISTRSVTGKPNLMPMSSSLFLGQTGVLGLGTRSQTSQNLAETGECVINLASVQMASNVNALALTTGRDPVPEQKADAGYEYVPDKFTRAGLTAVPSDLVAPARVAECPIAMEAEVVDIYPLAKDDETEMGSTIACEIRVLRTHVHERIRQPGTKNRISPHLWRPLIMNFQKFYGLADEVHPSRLSTIDEEWYR